MVYVLDTNTIIHYLQGNVSVHKNLDSAILDGHDLVIPRAVDYEMGRGFLISPAPKKQALYTVLTEPEGRCDIVDMKESFWGYAKQIYSDLYRKRLTVGEIDILIAAFCIDSTIEFIERVMEVVYKDLDNSSKKITDKKKFYNRLYNLDYIDVAFKLKVGERILEELSPGELGIVLLVFYLALSKDSTPIIIDQPEDNLDNQSVYSKLVPCIREAKKKRQVIIVTHNPNIAIACDAEQIIYCKIDKSCNSIRYESGSIENPKIKGHVIDVLEGTMPAFDLRKRKYFEYRQLIRR